MFFFVFPISQTRKIKKTRHRQLFFPHVIVFSWLFCASGVFSFLFLSLKCMRIHTHTGESDFMKFDKYTDTHMYMRASMASSFAQGKFKKERPQLTHAVESREQTVKVACINSNAHASHCTECWLLPHTHINVHGNKTNFCCCCCSFAAAAVSE